MKPYALLWMLLATSLARAQTADERTATVKYLQALQAGSGGFAVAPGKPTSLPATSAAVRTLRLLGAQPIDRTSARHYVLACYHDGAFALAPGGEPTVFSTSVGLMALVAVADSPGDVGAQVLGKAVNAWLGEHCKSFEDIRIAVAGLESVGQKAVKHDEWLTSVKLEYVDALERRKIGDPERERAIGSMAVALMRMGFVIEPTYTSIQCLQGSQAPDGGYAATAGGKSDMETVYRIMRALHMVKVQPKDPDKLRAYIAGLRSPDGAYAAAAGAKPDVRGTYYAITVLGWLK